DGFTVKAMKLAKVVERLAGSPNSTSSAIVNATGADSGTVSIGRGLVRRVAGKYTNIGQFPSVKSRGVARRIYKALKLLGDDQDADSAVVAVSPGLTAQPVDALKELVEQAGATMA